MPHDYDDDVPFHLPKEPGYEDDPDGNIHKLDTEDIVVPENLSQQMTAPRNVDDEPESSDSDADADEIARLHASDPPLQRGRPEDDSMLYRREGTEGNDPTVSMTDLPSAQDRQGAHDNQYTTDMDVPFRLPKEQHDAPEERSNENTVPRHAAQTLPGSGGLDPNPDFSDPKATIQNMRRVDATIQSPKVRSDNQNTVPSSHAQFARPVGAARQPIPNAPQGVAGPGAAQRVLPKRGRGRRRSKGFGCFAIFLGLTLTFCGGLSLITMILGGVAYARIDEIVEESIARLDSYDNFQSTFIYDRDGRPLFEVFDEGRRTNVSLDDIPQNLIDATLSIEDDSFYNNIGIDVGATFVAFTQYLGAAPDENTPGGSTITQQLVRNVLFDPEYRSERSVQRKAEEILLAIALTARKDKDEILEMYLNEIYYGNLAYGAQAASQIFFGKDVGELTLGQAALLAGLPQAPAELNPLNQDPDVQSAVFNRWRQVLNEMVEEGHITQVEMDSVIAQGLEGLEFNYSNISLNAPHFTVYAQEELEVLMQSLGYSSEEIALGGLQVFTTVDLEINDQAQAIAAQQIASLDPSQDVSNAAVVVVKPLTGEILAMVGSINYENDLIDGRVNVTTRRRQPGSTMKPFTYAAALELDLLTAGDVIWDTPMRLEQPGQAPYEPDNYDNSFHGPMTLRYALANSYNIPAVQTLRQVGVDYLLYVMERFGVESLGRDASRFGVSLTLGGGEVTLLELTNAYGVFANGGVQVDETSILCVLDSDNNIIYEYENGCPTNWNRRTVNRTSETVSRTGLGEQVLDARVAFIISDILNDNAARSTEMGSNSPLLTTGIDSSVKTGTTNDVKDNWTVGYTRNVAVGVWVGNNDGRSMRRTSGLTGAAPIWNQVITSIYNNGEWMDELLVDGQLQPDRHNAPSGVSQRQVCDIRNIYEPAQACSSRLTDWFLDYPARVPDGTGNLVDQPGQQDPQFTNTTQGTVIEPVDPGVYGAYRTYAMPLNPAVASAIQFNVPPGQPTPPAPKYCRVPIEAVSSTPQAQELVFIAPPPFDAAQAEQYAQSRGLAFLPIIDCTSELLVGGAAAGPSAVTAVIASPSANQTISGSIPITGTAQFTAEQAWYWKLEIIGGQWADWTDIQDVRYDSVVNGQLGTLPVLPGGSYRIRLLFIANDGNVLQQPYEVPFSVAGG